MARPEKDLKDPLVSPSPVGRVANHWSRLSRATSSLENIAVVTWKQVFRVLGATGIEGTFFFPTRKKKKAQVKILVPLFIMNAFHLLKFCFGEMDKK